MNSELVQLLLRVMLTSLGLMAVIMVCCIITPRLAKWIDSHKRPAKDDPPDPDAPTVRGAFDASSEPEYDLNHKIYHEDIYGLDLLKSKKKDQEQKVDSE